MASSAPVNWPACSMATGRGSLGSHWVTRTLTTVAANSQAFVRQARGRAAPAGVDSAASAPSLLECVTEGGGESLESGGKAGIDGSQVGVQPKFAARKRRVAPHVDRLQIEAVACQSLSQLVRVQRMSLDHRAARPSRF